MLRGGAFLGFAMATSIALLPATAGSAVQPKAVDVKVTPTPFYADAPQMTVSFRTLAVAPRGLYYAAWFVGSQPDVANPGCARTSATLDLKRKHWRSGRNKVVRTVLTPEPSLGHYFCPGPAHVYVELVSSSGRLKRAVGSLSFRVNAGL